MPRSFRRGFQIVLDLLVLSLAYWLANLIRFEFAIPAEWMPRVVASWPYVLVVELVALLTFGVPKFSWRYVSLRETLRIAGAVTMASTVLLVARATHFVDVGILLVPFGVLCANFFLSFLVLVTMRATRRIYGETSQRRQRGNEHELTRVLLIGAGQAGVMVAREIASRPDLGLQPVGFLDDDILKHGTLINGLPVLGATVDIERIAKLKHVNRALITIANAPGSQIRHITLLCKDAGMQTQIIPGIYEIVGERVNLSRIREVAIEDVLGREPVRLDEDQVASFIRDTVIMVTGAGGSIGSELCRQICRFEPSKLVLVERFENALFEIHRELLDAFPHITLVPQIADITDVRRMEQVFSEHRPDGVFHAAAHKHVPMMEWNPGEAVKNNVGGTRVVADLAHRFRVARFVMISTDKAVNPTSVMGTTKRVAEIYTQSLAQRSTTTKFVTVRFGNVLGSNGSVIPIFKAQIQQGGPVKVTHPDMQRYFMTIPEASQLVLQAGAMGEGGEIFILDMGKPVKIVDLARDLIRLSGFRPDEDIAIEFTGVRPGEKLFEELSTDSELADKTKHPKIFIGRIRSQTLQEVESNIETLISIAQQHDAQQIRNALGALVPEYSGASALLPSALPESAASHHGEPAIASS